MLRDAIIERMTELKINTNQLYEMLKDKDTGKDTGKDTVPRRTLYDFISGRCYTSSRVVSEIMGKLGLGIKKTKPKFKRRPKK